MAIEAIMQRGYLRDDIQETGLPHRLVRVKEGALKQTLWRVRYLKLMQLE
jgi:hypothetical protein